MRAKLSLVFATVLVCVYSAAAQTVIESESSVNIDGRFANVSLVLNSKAKAMPNVRLVLLDPSDQIRTKLDQHIKLSPGKRAYKFALPIGDLINAASNEIAWYRLKYEVGDAKNIVSLSQWMRDDFELRATAFERVIPGQPMRIRLRTLNRFNQTPVKGVDIKIDLSVDLDSSGDDSTYKAAASARTGSDGFTSVDFKIPENIKPNGDGEITIVGKKSGVVRKIEEDLDADDQGGTVLLTVDKPLYQPGQSFNVRGLYLDANSTVVPNSDLEFTIKDENNTTVFRQTVKTSSFGIAAVSWPIPDNARLGSYRVEVDADDELREDQLYFKVSRYDIPNFAVTAKSDKTYYLPGDTKAAITISADYLFGKPVTKGNVRVVEETDRSWDYSSQSYVSKEGSVVEGPADATGKYVAEFDLAGYFRDLYARDWQRYKDISFAVYFTDLTTNRAEQRRFDIRVTKEPIHVYLMRYSKQSNDLPLTAYVSTFYADGTPANCDIEVRDKKQIVDRFRSNSLGAGKMEFRIPKENTDGSRYEINIVARDKKGRVGTMDESYYLDADDAIVLRTDKTIYKQGDTIELDLFSSRNSGFIYVDLVKEWSPRYSSVVLLKNGKAHDSIPYRPSFRGDLTIAAYDDRETGRWSDQTGFRGVIFPEQQNLLLSAKFSKAEFRPAEDGTVRFSVLDGSGRPIESAIGIGIFDKGIEERARTETEFGGYFSRFYRYLGYDRSFGNLSLKDLNDLDMTTPVSDEMQLAAEIMLSGGWYYPTVYHNGDNDEESKTIYSKLVDTQIKLVREALTAQYEKDLDHPTDQSSFERILQARGVNPAQIIDPWGEPYFAEFTVNRIIDVIQLKTAGPDKKRGTSDDLVAYTSNFNYATAIGEAIDRAVLQYKNDTGKYIRDLEVLKKEAAKQGVDISNLRDRWTRPYKISFTVEGRNFVIRISSLGPNGIEDTERWRSDDFDLWTNSTDYFATSEAETNKVLDQEINLKKKPFPQSERDFRELLKRGGLDIADVLDGYGRPIYIVGKLETRYIDRTKLENGKTSITPATQEMMSFKLRTMGLDSVISSDDADLATFSAAITEARKGTGFAKAEVKTLVFAGAKGAISGTVTDANGAVVPGATVVAVSEADESKTTTVHTDNEGKFLLENLPSGLYTVQVTSPGFMNYRCEHVEVRSRSMAEINISLNAGSVNAVVDVSSDAALSTVNATSASISNTVNKTDARIKFPYKEQTSTPRLREYFPETLVWQPELITDKNGRAELKFKTADNITTWKMFAIASTKKGKIGVVEKEVTAFQSFFVDLDPPKFLTAGDEIYLPTQVRNYTDKQQKVDVTMDKAGWFTFLGGAKQRVAVNSGSSENAVFGLKAISPIVGGKQRVTAIGQTDSDAIERPVTVRPDGEEIVQTDSRYFNGSTDISLNFPANALAATQKAELKIYPNLFSHVAESVEGLLHRPYGCGEQTISSTYPNLMILKFVKKDSAVKQKAERYLQKGYERLLGYQGADGGFTYWGGKDPSDLALTAYALRFLADAREFINVDEDVIKKAETWLIAQQKADGSWQQRYRSENASNPDRARTKLTTTYVVRSLAIIKANGAKDTPNDLPRNQSLARGLAYLSQHNAEIDEPYAIALFGLASLDAGDLETAKQAAIRLEKMAIPEGSAAYWKLETNTAFYAWGTAGRVETTALVVQLLTRVAKAESKASPDAVSKGLLFLFKNKDRYGVWYSTQTTINVLDSFLATLASDGPLQPQNLRVSVNGTALPDVPVAADRIEPVIVDLTSRLSPTTNSIEVSGTSNGPLMTQIVGTHYIDWRDSKSTNADVGPSRALKLDYKCDRSNPAVMEEVTCSVNAERIGFQGYGMLLAEIGTPPGADISRESLEAAMQSDWSLSRYDILPDRIVLYMWSKAGGTRFNFRFRPRYGINAQTPASIVYDYYNPEAHATVAPLRFTTK